MFSNIRTLANTSVGEANTALSNTYTDLGQIVTLAAPVTEGNISSFPHVASLYDAYWYHSDHLGSSSYITNLNGVVTQHMEYLPYGETLVDEHQNSYNTPFKFNAKELDDETGNYYYGARYYNPKWSFWLSVDPLAEEYPAISSYTYVVCNPVNLIDPDGKFIIPISFKNRYPKLTNYMKNDVINSPVIVEAFAKITSADSKDGTPNLDLTALKEVFTNDKGPTLKFRSDPGGVEGANGYYDMQNESIQLNTSKLDGIEKMLGSDVATDSDKEGSLLGGFMLILHETAHHGDWMDGLRQEGGEPGYQLENEIWWYDDNGNYYSIKGDGTKFDPQAQQEILREKKDNGVTPTLPKN
jgi:RHS repeat-associated protein